MKTRACKPTPDEPKDMVARGVWMEQKLKTHDQKQCTKCGFFHVWTPRKAGAPKKPPLHRPSAYRKG